MLIVTNFAKVAHTFWKRLESCQMNGSCCHWSNLSQGINCEFTDHHFDAGEWVWHCQQWNQSKRIDAFATYKNPLSLKKSLISVVVELQWRTGCVFFPCYGSLLPAGINYVQDWAGLFEWTEGFGHVHLDKLWKRKPLRFRDLCDSIIDPSSLFATARSCAIFNDIHLKWLTLWLVELGELMRGDGL